MPTARALAKELISDIIDEIKANEEKSKKAEENLKELVRKRIEEIKKALP